MIPIEAAAHEPFIIECECLLVRSNNAHTVARDEQDDHSRSRRRNYLMFVNCAEPDEMPLSCRIWKPENDVAEERAEFTVTKRNMKRAPTTKLEIIKQSIVISAMKIWIAKITDNCISKCHRTVG